MVYLIKNPGLFIVLIIAIGQSPHDIFFSFSTSYGALAFEPITAFLGGVAVASTFVGTAYYKLQCHFKECCDDNWLPKNITGLEDSLRTKLYGQPLILSTLIEALRIHLHDQNPRKALVISLHGSTGLGKTFVSRLVAEHLFKKGTSSKFYHKYSHTSNFSDKRRLDQYRETIAREVVGSVRHCSRSLFVFDEMDKMFAGVMDSIKPYIDYDAQFDGLDFRKAIFIFLSNTGGQDINKYMLDHWRAGKTREAVDPAALHTVIQRAVFYESGGLQESSLVKAHLVNQFLPFLPLERAHVELCVRDELERRNCLDRYGLDDMRLILSETSRQLPFAPEDLQLYSISGCKRAQDALLQLHFKKPTLLTCL